MAKPVLLTVDDDREVLRAIERDLRRKYGSDYRVLRAGSGPEALEIVRELKIRNNSIALFLIDQRMPGMSGVEFLAQAITLFPDAKRVLLTAYADTDAAIAAINEAGINHYLLKPWDPPEENLYPVLDELLEDWQAAFPPQFEVSVCWETGGRLYRITSKTSWRVITCRINGSTSKLPLRIQKSAAWSSCSTKKRRAVCRS